jgi:two-component system cell cycle response regulator
LRAPELALCCLALGLALVAGRRAYRATRLLWWLVAASGLLWLGGRSGGGDVLRLGALATLAAALPLGFRGELRGHLARPLIDASAVAVALGGAGYTLVGGKADAAAAVAVATLFGALLVFRASTPSLAVGLAGGGSVLLGAGAAWLDAAALAGWLALSLAAVAALRETASRPWQARLRNSRTALVALAAVTASAVGALLAVQGRLSVEAFAIGVYGALAIGVRQGVAGRAKDAIAHQLEQALEAQYQLAVTDGLTRLHNRRFFEESLQLEAGRSRRGARSLGLLVIDLDHFKEVNDRHGHPAGDRVLVEAAERFAAIARPGDLLARYGGEEFVVMIPDVRPDVLGAIAERYRRAISQEPFALPGGGSVRVLTSIGGACMPEHAGTPGELVRVADKALYEAKRLGRDQVSLGRTRETTVAEGHVHVPAGVLDFLRAVADELEPHFSGDEHGALVASWAGLVCDELGLSAATRRRCVLAARLHDIGKIGVPAAILEKPGPLTTEEWRLVQQHPAIGARLVALVPGLEDVASVIAAHHERPDGRGYPRGTESIPIEARIVAVLDAWAAMTTPRSYREALERAQARAELARGMGRQFDEDVVRAFLDLDEHGLLSLATEARETRAA